MYVPLLLAAAIVAPAHDLAEMVKGADSIVIGRALIDVPARLIDVDVLAAPKGERSPGEHLIFDFPSVVPPKSVGKLPVAGLFFIKSSNGRLEAMPLTLIDHRTSIRELFLMVSERRVGDHLTLAPPDPEVAVLNELLSRFDERIIAENVGPYLQLLTHRSSQHRLSFFERCMISEKPEVRVLGLVGLLGIKPERGLELLIAEPSLAEAVNGSVSVRSSVRERLRTDVPGQLELMGQLTRLIEAPLSLRRAAAHSLRAIHSSASLPDLRALLDSEDPQMQQEGLAGLVAYAMDFPITTPDLVPSMRHMLSRDLDTRVPQEFIDNFPRFEDSAHPKERVLEFWRRWYDENFGGSSPAGK